MQVNWTIAFPIIGSILSIIGITLAIKNRKKTNLNFIELSCLELFSNFISKNKDFEVLFRKDSINQNVVQINGLLLNTGNVDINREKFHGNVQIILPDGCKWLMLDISSKTKIEDTGLDYSLSNENKIAELSWSMLKAGEGFEIHALVEVPDGSNTKNLCKELSFKSRILNLKKISKKSPITPEKLLNIGLLALLVVSFVLAFFSILMLTDVVPKPIYTQVTIDSTKCKVAVYPYNKDHLLIVAPKIKTLDISGANMLVKHKIIVVKRDQSLMFFGIFLTLLIAFLMLFFANRVASFLLARKIKRYQKIRKD